MSNGGVIAEYMVRCESCDLDVEPGRFYDTRADAMRVRNRAVRHESWLLSSSGSLLCPECAESGAVVPSGGA